MKNQKEKTIYKLGPTMAWLFYISNQTDCRWAFSQYRYLLSYYTSIKSWWLIFHLQISLAEATKTFNYFSLASRQQSTEKNKILCQ